MPDLSGLEVAVLIREIGVALTGSYINNIYTLGGAQLLRLRKPGGEEAWLVASPKHGVWVSEKVSERGETEELTTRLRQGLERARYAGASQADLDRVFVLEFGEKESARRLIVEMMPPGNLFLTDGTGSILLAMREVKTRSRRLVRGSTYSAPSQARLSPSQVRAEDVSAFAQSERTAGQAIGRHVALPRKYVAEALDRLSLKESAEASALLGREAEVIGVLRGMLESTERPRPCLAETASGEEIFVFHPQGSKVKMEAPTVSALCDELLLPGVAATAVPPKDSEQRRREELDATIASLRSESLSLRSRAAELRSLAPGALAAPTIGEALKFVGEAGLKPRNLPSSTAAAASLIYDAAKRVEDRASAAEEAAARLSKSASKTGRATGTRMKALARRSPEWYEKFRWFRTSAGKLAIGGRDTQSNALLVRRHAQDDDVIYHADLFGSPFFVLKGGKAQTQEETREVAQATVTFSSAWKTGLGSADAYWVAPEQVSSTAPSGEYLPKGSFAIRGKKNVVGRNLVEVAIGLDGEGRLVSGPEAAIAGAAASYLVLRPQREKSSDTAKAVLKGIAAGGRAPGLSVDDVLRALPAGGGKVVRIGAKARSQAGGGP